MRKPSAPAAQAGSILPDEGAQWRAQVFQCEGDADAAVSPVMDCSSPGAALDRAERVTASPATSRAAPNYYEDTATAYKGSKPLGLSEEGAALPAHQTWFFYLQRLCNHCTYPACLAACPRKAIYKRPEDGIVLIDQERCRGYRKCVEACPYKKPMYRGTTGTSEKCMACYPRVEGKTQ